ncbi:MAG: NUDIX domain-containing protein [Clostridia bacterium]|nr:NUDIX domain-containing protein [Clostridia bacterium]
MDICIKLDNNRVFNYRTCAVIINDKKLLVLKDNHAEYYYLPGGRVQFGETAENALLRELKEELNITPSIVRPLFINQSFFNEDAVKKDYHEICMYFLVDISKTDILTRGSTFLGIETKKEQCFTWLSFDRVKNEYLYPLFIKERIDNLPSTLELITEIK